MNAEHADYAKASDPATGDSVIVRPDEECGFVTYSINGEPSQREHQRGRSLMRAAFDILRRHALECEATDAEELTLP